MQVKIFRVSNRDPFPSFSPAAVNEELRAIRVAVPDDWFVDKEADLLIAKSGEAFSAAAVLQNAMSGTGEFYLVVRAAP